LEEQQKEPEGAVGFGTAAVVGARVGAFVVGALVGGTVVGGLVAIGVETGGLVGAVVGGDTGAAVGGGTGTAVGGGTGAVVGGGTGAAVGGGTGASVGFGTGELVVGLSSTLLSQNSGMPNGYWLLFSSQQLSLSNSKGHSTDSYWTVGLSQLRLKKLLHPASKTGLLKALQSQFWVGS